MRKIQRGAVRKDARAWHGNVDSVITRWYPEGSD